MRMHGLRYVVLLLSVCSASYAGIESLPKIIISPQVRSDRRVTFRLKAPDAKRVSVAVEFRRNVAPMSKGKDGIWSVTLGPAEPGIYEYNFVVDGLAVVDPSNSWLKVWRSNSKNLVEVHGKESMFFQEQRVPHGVVHIHKYWSKSLNIPRGLYVYTPPSYEENKNKRYPVLYLLHGMGDCADAWTVVGRANVIIDNLLAMNRVEPFVIVMPYGHTPSAPPDIRGIDNYGAFEKDLIEDVMPYIQVHYSVGRDRKDRAIAGLSMGGGQSLTIGLGNPELFGWIGAFSSAIPRADVLNNLLAKWKNTDNKLNLLWVGCGDSDFLFESNMKFIGRLRTDNIKHVARITDGGHQWSLWRRYLNEFAPLLFRSDM